MTVTVLGANGRLGAMLDRHAGRAGLDWQMQQRGETGGLRWSGSFDDPAVADFCCAGSTIINMIGYTGSDQDMLQAVNVDFVQRLLKHAADRGVAHVVLASSASVYGNGAAFHENSTLAPTSSYGASKAAMEEIAHSNRGGPNITILRIGNVAGADALLNAAREKVAIGKRMDLHRFPNGNAATRSYIGPLDLARITASLVKVASPEAPQVTTLNVAHPRPVTLDSLLTSYRTHLLPDLNWQDMPAPKGVPEKVVLNVDALQQHYTFSPVDNPADHFARQVVQDRRP